MRAKSQPVVRGRLRRVDDAFWTWLQTPRGHRGVAIATVVMLCAISVAKVIGGRRPAAALIGTAVVAIVAVAWVMVRSRSRE
jgi:hypothetical protein